MSVGVGKGKHGFHGSGSTQCPWARRIFAFVAHWNNRQNLSHYPETVVVVAIIWSIVVAIGGTQVVAIIVPGAAAQHAIAF